MVVRCGGVNEERCALVPLHLDLSSVMTWPSPELPNQDRQVWPVSSAGSEATVLRTLHSIADSIGSSPPWASCGVGCTDAAINLMDSSDARPDVADRSTPSPRTLHETKTGPRHRRRREQCSARHRAFCKR